MNKLLIITYHFPPDSAVGGLRSAKFARYLPQFGWQPYVLTVRDKYREQFDAKRTEDVKGIKVFKTGELPTFDQIYQRVKGAYRTSKKSQSVEAGATIFHATNSSRREGVLKKIKRHLISLVIMLPDQKKNWVVPAYIKALKLIRSEGITHVMTSSPHHSTHLIGLLLKKTTQVKWVADFRDPWTDVADFKPSSIRSELGDKIERWMESSVVRNSDRTMVTTKALERIFRKKYSRELKEKFLYIPNAIFTDKFRNFRNTEKYENFTITYAGTLYGKRTPEPVFKAVKELLEEGRVDRGRLKIKLIGNCRNSCGVPTSEIVKAFGLENIVDILDPVPFDEAVEVMCGSHLLLLLAIDQKMQIPAKVYDYLGAGTDMLVISEQDSATAELVRSTGSGHIFTQDDIKGIKNFISRAIKEAGRTGKPLAEDRFKSFDIAQLTNKLAHELGKIAGQCL